MNQTQVKDPELEKWEEYSSKAFLVALFIYLVARALMTISSATAFIQIVCIRKHHHLLYILIPLCFLISGAIGFALEIFAIKLKLEG